MPVYIMIRLIDKPWFRKPASVTIEVEGAKEGDFEILRLDNGLISRIIGRKIA